MTIKIDMADIEFIEGIGSINLSNHDDPDRAPHISIMTPLKIEGDVKEVQRQLYKNAVKMLVDAQQVLEKELQK